MTIAPFFHTYLVGLWYYKMEPKTCQPFLGKKLSLP